MQIKDPAYPRQRPCDETPKRANETLPWPMNWYNRRRKNHDQLASTTESRPCVEGAVAPRRFCPAVELAHHHSLRRADHLPGAAAHRRPAARCDAARDG